MLEGAGTDGVAMVLWFYYYPMLLRRHLDWNRARRERCVEYLSEEMNLDKANELNEAAVSFRPFSKAAVKRPAFPILLPQIEKRIKEMLRTRRNDTSEPCLRVFSAVRSQCLDPRSAVWEIGGVELDMFVLTPKKHNI